MRASVLGVGLWSGFVLLSCANDRTTPDGTGGDIPKALVESCARYCALGEVFPHTCEPGQKFYHGAAIGHETPPDAAPVSSNQECIASCTALSPTALCWQAEVAWMDCSVDAVWVCSDDDTIGTSECGASGRPELCDGRDARPAAWQQSEGWTAACQRYCGLAEVLLPECSPGDTRIRGVPLGAEPPAEPSISNDPACMGRCLEPNSAWECADQLIAAYNCFANALWVCQLDSTWYTDECEAEDAGNSVACE
jgi:hypothetical protein